MRVVWGAFVVGLVLVGMAVFAIPSFSSHPRFESSVIGDMRTVLSSEVAYSSANGGFYGPLECLAEPARCLKGYSGPTFLERRVVEPERYRYRRTLHPGPERQGENGARGFTSFAYTAVPLKHRSYSVRSFCADDTGVLRQDPSGAAPALKDGRCPEGMARLD
jgi:hypothetical protein